MLYTLTLTVLQTTKQKAQFSNAHNIGVVSSQKSPGLLLPIKTEPYVLQLSVDLFGNYHPHYRLLKKIYFAKLFT